MVSHEAPMKRNNTFKEKIKTVSKNKYFGKNGTIIGNNCEINSFMNYESQF